MLAVKNQRIGLAVAAAVLAVAAGMAQATTVPPALPGGATNLFAGDYAIGGAGGWNGAGFGPTNITDNDLDSYAISTYETTPIIDVQGAIMATPGSSPVTSTSGLGTTGTINVIRIWAQPLDNGGGITTAYVVPPPQVSIMYGFNGPDPTNYDAINADNFSSTASILAVNGVATPTGTTTVYLANDWQGPVADGLDGVGASSGALYVDLTVSAFSSNAVYFNFGVQPNRTTGNGGMDINEIQAYASAVPEPAALGLIAVGGLGLLLWPHRKTV